MLKSCVFALSLLVSRVLANEEELEQLRRQEEVCRKPSNSCSDLGELTEYLQEKAQAESPAAL